MGRAKEGETSLGCDKIMSDADAKKLLLASQREQRKVITKLDAENKSLRKRVAELEAQVSKELKATVSDAVKDELHRRLIDPLGLGRGST